MKTLNLCLTTLLLSTFAHAHHTSLAIFDPTATTEIEGVVTDVHWSNPHVRLGIGVADAAGDITEWNIELTSLSAFRSRGYHTAFVEVGEMVKVFGNPAKSGLPAMEGLNLLLENGTEVILEFVEGPHYALMGDAPVLEIDAADSDAVQLARESAEGIFRVWNTIIGDPNFPIFRGNYPLTEVAAARKSEWVPDREKLESCWTKSIPHIMGTPHPIEFSRSGNDILLSFEEDDARRLIHMLDANEEHNDEDAVPSRLGYSIGIWEGDTLVVETTKLNSPYLDDRGTIQSEDMHVIERFTPSENGEQLDFQITFTDPVAFTAPVKLAKTFVWQPERNIVKWDCDA
ncbi:MAG: hypothetical protein HOJ88_00405 [Proteobacteria bacterium]|nr:hypothetical protein [Pseudomonadota bacterium]